MIDLTKYSIGGVEVSDVTRKDMGKLLRNAVLRQQNVLVFSMNGEGIAYYHKNKEFKKFVDQANIVHPDGWSTMMAGRLFTKGKFVERVATTDAYSDMLRVCAEESIPVYFLGGAKEVIHGACRSIQKEFPTLNIAGFRDGYFDESQYQEVFKDINISMANVVFVGLGRPYQESFSIQIKNNCPNVYWIKTCGGLFDFLSGKNPRAPLWMQNVGLEWLFRMLNEPKRLFWRYFWTNIYSLYFYVIKK